MKKLLFCLLFGLVTGLYANTGIQDVYWDMPYTKLLLEKKVIEDEIQYKTETIKVLIESKKKESYVYFFDKTTDKLKLIITNTKNIKYFKKNIKIEFFTTYANYNKREISDVSNFKCNNNFIKPYLIFIEELLKGKESEYLNTVISQYQEENIKEKAKGKIQICNIENTNAVIFENIIENENFIILLPYKGE